MIHYILCYKVTMHCLLTILFKKLICVKVLSTKNSFGRGEVTCKML